MSADTLRRAAARMRELAEAATPGPWRFTDSEVVYDVGDGGMVVVNKEGDPIANVCDEWYEGDPGEPAPINDAEHIAAWGPPVALAVADWLDETARGADEMVNILTECGERPELNWSSKPLSAALAVARQFLREAEGGEAP